MTEMPPERPLVADLAQIFGNPVATVLVRADEVLLGDVVDSTDGAVRVREIVERPFVWDLAGDPPGQSHTVGAWHRDTPPPATRVRVNPSLIMRVRRSVAKFGRLSGHAKRVHSHNPVKRGWYTHVEGYLAECSCSWKSATVHPGKHAAAQAWLGHKAGQLSESAYASNSALLLIDTSEVVHPQLPGVPWRFSTVLTGDRQGRGIAKADISTMPLDQARAVMSAWQALPGLTTDDHGTWDTHHDSAAYSLRGPRSGVTDLRLSLDDQDATRLILTASFNDPVPGTAPW
jgi:hypothetical protein